MRLAENFATWGFCADPIVDDSTYLAAFLVCWLRGYFVAVSSTTIRLETFLQAMEMAKGKKYSLVVPILPFFIRFCENLARSMRK